MSFDKLKTKIEENNIKHIVSIDDDWVNRQDVENCLRSMGIDIEPYEADFDEVKSSNSLEVITVTDFLENKYHQLSKLSKEFEYLFDEEKKDLRYIKELAIKLELEFEKISDMTKLSTYSGTENTLFFIDREFTKTGEDDSLDLITKIQEKNKSNFNIFIIYSHIDLVELENHKSKKKYLEEYYRTEHGESVADKDFFDVYKNIYLLHGFKKGKEDLNKFIEETYEKFEIAVYGKSLQDIFEAKKQVEYETYKEIYSRDLEDYEKLYEDAIYEGEPPTEVIKKLVKGLKKHSTQTLWDSHSGKYEKFSKEINRKIEEKVSTFDTSNKKATKDREEAFRLAKINLILKDDKVSNSILNKNVNPTYSDINKGDLFCINDAFYGVVISKECDSIIRCNTKAGTSIVERGNKKFQLLKLNSEVIQDPETTSTKVVLNKFNESIWPINIKDKIFLFYSKNEIIEIDSEILDLCSLNCGGKASLEYDKKYENFKSYYSNQYFKTFDFESKIEIENYLNDFIKDDIKENQKKILVSSIKNGINLIKKDDTTNEFKGFNIERIGRLQSQRTLYLLQDYISRFTKPGFNTTATFN